MNHEATIEVLDDLNAALRHLDAARSRIGKPIWRAADTREQRVAEEKTAENDPVTTSTMASATRWNAHIRELRDTLRQRHASAVAVHLDQLVTAIAEAEQRALRGFAEDLTKIERDLYVRLRFTPEGREILGAE